MANTVNKAHANTAHKPHANTAPKPAPKPAPAKETGVAKEDQFTKGQKIVVRVAKVKNTEKHNEVFEGYVLDSNSTSFTIDVGDGVEESLKYDSIVR